MTGESAKELSPSATSEVRYSLVSAFSNSQEVLAAAGSVSKLCLVVLSFPVVQGLSRGPPMGMVKAMANLWSSLVLANKRQSTFLVIHLQLANDGTVRVQREYNNAIIPRMAHSKM